MSNRLIERLSRLGIEFVEEPEKWHAVTKARDMPEAILEDDVGDFLGEHGWEVADGNENAFRHPVTCPQWVALGEAYAIEQRESDSEPLRRPG